jgi:rubrerythrin
VFSPKELLDIAIRIEKNGESSYRNAVKNTANPVISVALQWMADEEASHAKWFTELRQKLESDTDNPIMEEMARSLLEDLLGKKCFSLEEIESGAVEDMAQLISISVEFENDTILFYEMIMSFIQDEAAKTQLEVIISEEKRHIEQLEKLKTEDAELEQLS